MTERRLYLFESGNPDWCVAYDEADALAAWCEHVGETPADYDAGDWEKKPDDYTAKYWIDSDGHITSPDNEDGGELVELTAAEVVQRFPRGFLASVDF